MVSSGAVAFGRQRLQQEELLSRTVRSTLAANTTTLSTRKKLESQACAAVGQAGLMALYESMFAQYGVSCAQVMTRAASCGESVSLPRSHKPDIVWECPCRSLLLVMKRASLI